VYSGRRTWQAELVRWDDLFADLDGQLLAGQGAALQAELTERTRAEHARRMLVERLTAHVGRDVTVGVAGVGPVAGRLVDAVGAWLVVAEGAGRCVLVPARAWRWVDGLSRSVEAPASAVTRRSSLGSALRALAARRAAVTLHLPDGTALTGTIDRVAADHLDLALHTPGEPRRRGSVTGVRVVPQACIVAVRYDEDRS
jgi:hypothetical protein